MILTNDNLIGLKVVTKNGQVLGKIKDFEIEIDGFVIEKFIVSSSDLVKKITAQNLIINRNQVIEITAKKMIVDDNLISNTEIIKQTATI